MPSQPSRLQWQSLSLPKRGHSPEEYEDALAGDPRSGRFAVADGASESSFAGLWARAGSPIPAGERRSEPGPVAGEVAMRVVASEPYRAELLLLDQLIASAARETLWLADAYYSGVPSHVQALRSAALDGVDVRLLLPGATDLPVVRSISRAGYRVLLEAGVRIFEWNGPMLHSKTAVADGRWARVGSSNLNVASWLANYELDAVIEDAEFAGAMALQYELDLANSTEVVPAGTRCQT